METVFSYLRLVVGCGSAFLGLAVIIHGSEDYRWTGIILGGVGGAMALNETAYVIARFVRGNLDSSEPKA